MQIKYVPNQTIRVVILTTSFPLGRESVSGVFVKRLVENLPATVRAVVITPAGTVPVFFSSDYELHCFRYAPWKYQLLAHQPGGIPVALKQLKALRWILPAFLGAMFVACFQAARKSDIIHANWSVNGAIAGLVGFLLRKPVITTLRGEDVTRAQNSKVYRYILAWCIRSNFKLLTVSEAIYSLLLKEFPGCGDKIYFLPNGVDPKLLNNRVVENKSINIGIFNLLAIGSLITRKGVETIIEALSRLYAPQNYRLSVVGDGPELNNLKELAKQKSLSQFVDFIGQVPPNQIASYFHNADAFILASHSEGRPNVVLESFAAGVPVIASDIDGVRELLKENENGMTFPPGNASELAIKIEELQQDKNLQELFSKRGKEFIIKNNLLDRKSVV